MVLLCLTHSYHCHFTKYMIRSSTMGSIHRPSNPGNRSTEDTDFMQCVDGWEPQIHELWCLGLDNVTFKARHTVQVQVTSGTVG